MPPESNPAPDLDSLILSAAGLPVGDAHTEHSLPPELRNIIRSASGLPSSEPLATHVHIVKKRHDDQVLTFLKVCALRLSRHAGVRH